MFGTMGFSELIIILVIILIIFGAGRLPQIGEGVGKALRGFKKEVQESLPPTDPAAQQGEATAPNQEQSQAAPAQPASTTTGAAAPAAPKPTAPYTPGPELTPGTTAAMMAAAAPQAYQPPPKPAPITISQPIQPAAAQAAGHQPPTMEDRMAQPAPAMRPSYPPLPPSAQTKPAAKRPSAIVNKDAVARVQAQQAAMRTKTAQSGASSSGLTPDDMGSFGQGLGEAFRMMKDVTAEVRGAIDPQVRTLRAEVDAASKEIEQSIEAAKELPAVQEEPPAKPA